MNITKVTGTIVQETKHLCPMQVHQAEMIANKFSELFRLFANCHNVYNKASFLSDSEIVTLGK